MTRIADLALLSDLETAALVDRAGAVVWACLPRFDGGACFASLLGDEDHGHWLVAPADDAGTVERRYRSGLVLESTWTTPDGQVTVTDCMPVRDGRPPCIVRQVRGEQGRVEVFSELILRFDYGSVIPWVRRDERGDLVAIAGPDSVRLHAEVDHVSADFRTTSTFEVGEGDAVHFVLEWQPSHLDWDEPHDGLDDLIDTTERWWADWRARSDYDGDYAATVQDSLAVLKGLTFAPTGGIVAAPTTSLPEAPGGERNWDYRYCWLRDATFTLLAFLGAGYLEEAEAWRDWLLRAVAGDPEDLQIMYGVAGERRLPELELDWLPGHRSSRPVRIGNAAFDQFQIDVWGEVMDALHQARVAGLETDDDAWALQRQLAGAVERHWRDPDEGIWEVRSERKHFTHSKLMAWVAMDRVVRAVEDYGLDGPVERWRAVRDEIRDDVLTHGVDDRGVFTQTYGSNELDASLLLVPIVGFLPADDERVVTTTQAIMDELTENGLVLRYRTDASPDGLEGEEGAFLLCSFWLAENLALQGRLEEARELFERLLDLRNDVGLLSEEASWDGDELLGNMPQAFSHLAIVNTAMQLCAQVDDGVTRRAAPR